MSARGERSLTPFVGDFLILSHSHFDIADLDNFEQEL